MSRHGFTSAFAALLEQEDLYVPANEIIYFSHWITAAGRPRRFNTRFFVARAPHGQDGAHDRSNLERFPPDKYRTVLCGGFRDYTINLGSSHQYYRRSPGVRMDIANTMAGNV